MTFYAVWKPRPVLTLNANAVFFGGLQTIRIPASDSLGNISASLLQLYVLQRGGGATLNPTSPWNTQADGSDQSRSTDSDITLDNDEEWFAQWQLPEKYVRFHANTTEDDSGEGTIIALCRNQSYPSCSSGPSWKQLGSTQLAYETQEHPFTSGTSDVSNDVTKATSTTDRALTLVAGRSAHNTNQSVVRMVT